eukprot:1144929-Pelagomonas_calceolata.AAC.2
MEFIGIKHCSFTCASSPSPWRHSSSDAGGGLVGCSSPPLLVLDANVVKDSSNQSSSHRVNQAAKQA